ncbi:Uncharacterized protein TCM_009635 [Theobroma cacao]|uniref:CCHC-type domain-containing protein n=1 Tax=Theobroma cacao TaxID=3641 RepID=A0A061E566_THECC|nr:Uncharacterized protein TCM_009635 [Theobroma cacao]
MGLNFHGPTHPILNEKWVDLMGQTNFDRYTEKASTSKGMKPTEKVKKDKDNDKCHFCGKLGYWRHNCKDYLESIKGKKQKKASTLERKRKKKVFLRAPPERKKRERKERKLRKAQVVKIQGNCGFLAPYC